MVARLLDLLAILPDSMSSCSASRRCSLIPGCFPAHYLTTLHCSATSLWLPRDVLLVRTACFSDALHSATFNLIFPSHTVLPAFFLVPSLS